MISGLRALMVLTDGFGGTGGIAKFNRDFLQAIDSCGCFERVQTLPRAIFEPIEETCPEFVVYDRKAARGKMAFMLRLAVHAWRDGQTDLVICGHIHLLPAAWLLARLHGAGLVLIIHGLEAWAPSRKRLANWLAHHMDTFIAVSKFSAKRFTQWSKLSADRGFILPNCVDLDQLRPQRRDETLGETVRFAIKQSHSHIWSSGV